MSIVLGKYKNKKKLGKGAYGEVMLVQDPTGKQFAIKMISKNSLSSQPFLEEYLESEKQCMMSVKSKHIMELFAVEEDNNYFYFICQYCNGGDLLGFQAKQANKIFTKSHAVQILSQVIHGLFLVHSMGYLHRDIKPQNILIKKQNTGNVYKLADFGFAKRSQQIGGTVLGTQNYMAPQIFSHQVYSFQVDMWAFGVLFYFMLNMEFPFKLNPHLPAHQKKQELTKIAMNFSYAEAVGKSKKKVVENCTPEIEDLFQKMLNPDADQRISFADIREHPIFKEHFMMDNEASKILYANKKKGFDRAQSFIQKRSAIQKLPQKPHPIPQQQSQPSLHPIPSLRPIPSLHPVPSQHRLPAAGQNTDPSYYLKRSSTQTQKHIIQLQYERIDFLLGSEQELSVNLTFLDASELLALRYNLLKYYIVLLRDWIQQLKCENYEDRYGKLQWRQFFKTSTFCTLLTQFQDKLDSAQIKISQTYDQCISSLPNIRKHNPKLQKTLSPQINQSEHFGGAFKQTYRISTMQAYKQVRAMIDNGGNRYFYLTLLVALCHGYNQIMEADQEEIRDIFRDLDVGAKGDQFQIMDFGELRAAMTRATKEQLTAVFQQFLKNYFNISP